MRKKVLEASTDKEVKPTKAGERVMLTHPPTLLHQTRLSLTRLHLCRACFRFAEQLPA